MDLIREKKKTHLCQNMKNMNSLHFEIQCSVEDDGTVGPVGNSQFIRQMEMMRTLRKL